MGLLRGHAGLLDDAQILCALALHKLLELGDRHRRYDGPRGLQARLDVRLGEHRVNILVQPVDDRLRRAARREKTGP